MPVRLPAQVDQLPARALPALEIAGLIAAIGTQDRTGFGRAALHLAATTMPVAHATLFAHRAGAEGGDAGSAPRILSGASEHAGDRFVFDVFHEYGAELYPYDSNRRAERDALSQPRGLPQLRRQCRSEIEHGGYRRFYERGAMVDRVSVLVRAGRDCLALNFYRDDRQGRYRADELRRFGQIAPVLASAAERHYALTGTQEGDWASRLLRIAPELTPRELSVVCGLLDGATLKTVARGLGIQPSTAATYRDRAYQRLSVRSLRDLPARLI